MTSETEKSETQREIPMKEAQNFPRIFKFLTINQNDYPLEKHVASILKEIDF